MTQYADHVPPDAIEAAANIERIATMARHQHVAACSNVLAPSLVVALSWSFASHAFLLICWLAFAAIAALQLHAWWTHRNRPVPKSVSPKTISKLVVWAGVWGLSWGIFTAVLIASQPPPTTFAILCGLVMGIGAGGMAMLYPTPRAIFAFFAGLAVPPLIVLLAAQDMDCLILAIFEIMFFGFLLASSHQSYKTFITDITLKLQNAELAYRADAASRSKSRFLANMSHELRTPLNAINGFAEIIQHQFKGPVGNPQYLEFAKAIHDSGRHLVALIDDILDISKIESGQATLEEKPARVHSIINQMVTMTDASVKRAQLELVATIEPGLPEINVDERKICQVLLNLVSNAIKFTPQGGKIGIGAMRNSDGGISLTVWDTGAGIAAEEIQDVLKPFMRSREAERRQVPGSGLGLHLSQELMRLHGGTLTIRSTLGQGTKVTATIPASRVIAAPRAQQNAG